MVAPMQIPDLTDRTALTRNRARAMAGATPALFLQEDMIAEVQERLIEVNRTFTAIAVVTGFPDLWRKAMPGAHIVADADILALEPGAHDLVITRCACTGRKTRWANLSNAVALCGLTGCFWLRCLVGRRCTNSVPPWPRPRRR